MTKFEGGPAEGKSLLLRRAPLYLRVVRDASGKIDALDQLDDAPEPGEQIYAYRRTGEVSVVHIDSADARGRRQGRWYQGGQYAICTVQPDDAAMRCTALWRKWCEEQVNSKKEQP